MIKTEGIHFYINIANLDDVAENEEKTLGEMQHTIHALDTFFTSIEAYGLRHYPGALVVEKITSSRLHMYVEGNDIGKKFEIVSAVSKYAYMLTTYMTSISKYKSLLKFDIQIGACFGRFMVFEFKRENADETTTIGYAANYAAKLQALSRIGYISISKDLYEALIGNQVQNFVKREDASIIKYDQNCYYESRISELVCRFDMERDLEKADEYAKKVTLQSMQFRDAYKKIDYRNLSKTECKKIIGIPVFADVRGFTKQFDSDDINLEEMARKTQQILTSMYEIIEQRNGVHVQFQGDREVALFHEYEDHDYVSDAVVAGLKMIDTVKQYGVSIGVGQALGRLFAAKIGARGSKDNILLGRTVAIADHNEDVLAEKNQLVITRQVYEHLKKSDSKLCALFKVRDAESYYTEWGYAYFVSYCKQRQLEDANDKKSYNGAWKMEKKIGSIME